MGYFFFFYSVCWNRVWNFSFNIYWKKRNPKHYSKVIKKNELLGGSSSLTLLTLQYYGSPGRVSARMFSVHQHPTNHSVLSHKHGVLSFFPFSWHFCYSSCCQWTNYHNLCSVSDHLSGNMFPELSLHSLMTCLRQGHGSCCLCPEVQSGRWFLPGQEASLLDVCLGKGNSKCQIYFIRTCHIYNSHYCHYCSRCMF